jgi:hypothetical protein
LQIVKQNIVCYLLHVGNFIQQIPASKFVWLLVLGLVAVYRVHPTKPVRHRYPVCSVSVRIVIARKTDTRHGITEL